MLRPTWLGLTIHDVCVCVCIGRSRSCVCMCVTTRGHKIRRPACFVVEQVLYDWDSFSRRRALTNHSGCTYYSHAPHPPAPGLSTWNCTNTWWRHETNSIWALLALCEVKSTRHSPPKWPNMWRSDLSFFVVVNELAVVRGAITACNVTAIICNL